MRSQPQFFAVLFMLAACGVDRSQGLDTEPPQLTAAVSAASPGAESAEALAQVPVVEAQPAGLSVERSWKRIVVDAGHGGDDEGAIGVSGAQEKDITLSIAREMKHGLEARGFEVVETRTEDLFLSLERRTSIANASGAALMVSIHANAAPSPQAHGIETYYMDLASDEAAMRLAERENRSGQLALADDEVVRAGVDELISELRMGATAQHSRELAERLHTGLLRAGSSFYGAGVLRDRGVRTAPFWVLVDSQIPSVLIEVGYLTSKDEEKRLRTRGFHNLAGETLAAAVADFSERAARSAPGAAVP
ncbi:MAG: hypothetical protein CMP23_08450 [Rickettsiales bacterium]|nr:hypothetical protein [Rickettsiales bacterium]